MEKIEFINIEDRKIAIVFDGAKMAEEKLLKLTTESLEKLGHKPTEHLHIV